MSAFEGTLLQIKDHQKTIQQAEAFLNSMKEFNKNQEVDDAAEFDSDSDSFDRDSGNLGNHSGDSDLKRIPILNFGHEEQSYSSPLRYNDLNSAFRADLLTFIEVYFYSHKKLPTQRDLHTNFENHPLCPKFIKDWAPLLDSIADSLFNRGIQPYRTTENFIDPKFAWAVSLIVNVLDKRTIPAKLKEAGLSTKEWTAFLRRRNYYEYFQGRLDQVFDEDVKNTAKLQLANLIQNGDLGAIKYYNELTNIYRPELQNPNQMVAVVLTAVMEILAAHVSSEILSKIATEIRSTPSVTKVIEAIERG